MGRFPRGGRAAVLVLPFAAALASSARAQLPLDGEMRLAPQYVQYRFGAPSGATISQLAVPVFVAFPVGDRLVIDVGAAYASTRLTGDSGRSEVSGLTDTQVRGNLTVGRDFLVVTAGVSLPTGHSRVMLDQLAAAGLIANDFLAFPVSSMGTGLAFTGGLAIAQPLGDWNLGVGGAVRRSTSFEPVDVPGQTIRFQPGDEYRARVGVDRVIGAGRLALGLGYSAFGRDDVSGSAYNTGDRVIMQGAWAGSLPGRDVVVSAYNLFRAPGSVASGEPTGRENLADLLASVALDPLGARVEPSVELRHWRVERPARGTGAAAVPARTESSVLATLGLRAGATLGGVRVTPGVSYTVGRFATQDAASGPAHARLTGFRAQLAMRVGR